VERARNRYPLSFTLRMPDLIEAVDDVLAHGGTQYGELIERTPVERVYQFDAGDRVLVGVRDEMVAGNAGLAILIFRDLTEAKRLNDQMRADFVADASYESRTPLASAFGLYREGTSQGPAKNDAAALTRFLDVMRSQAGRIARLIDDLLLPLARRNEPASATR